MKIHIKNILVALASATMFTACIGDLDTLPLNKTDVTSESAYGAEESGYIAGLTKLYFNFLNTSDLQVKDGGASELIRAFWSAQEATADACKVAWKDEAMVAEFGELDGLVQQEDGSWVMDESAFYGFGGEADGGMSDMPDEDELQQQIDDALAQAQEELEGMELPEGYEDLLGGLDLGSLLEGLY